MVHMLTKEEILVCGHWADVWAAKVIRAHNDKDSYTCASGITPSGTVHIGNFREIISVDLVVRALRQMGKHVRFIYSWDDYDVFRKVPKNMPNQELLAKYLRQPIDSVPDTYGQYENYALANEKHVEQSLPLVGICPEYIYQSQRYRNSVYAEGIRRALECQDVIVEQLNEFRTEPLPVNWMPISIFCEQCHCDTTKPGSWDKDWQVSYSCQNCGHKGELDLRHTGAAKLPWRIDWPMRWAYEGVDFEPAGKDHHSDGGSFSTAKKTVQAVYGKPAPISFQYDFVRIKGGAGKISSSSGEVVDLTECLQIYQPEVVRFLFCSTRPNSEFAVSFDLDVLKNYEDYDRLERNYYQRPEGGLDDKSVKKWLSSARIYELSQVEQPAANMPYQIGIRHLCTLLQIYEGNIEATIAKLPGVSSGQIGRLTVRCTCAWNWIQHHAPEDFRFVLQKESAPLVELNTIQTEVVCHVLRILPLINEKSEDDFATALYQINTDLNIESITLFTAVYQALLGKEKGPRLVSFLYTIGVDRLKKILQRYA